ncbi:hypothetical protein [Archangium lansingense]|uniref:Lipoprotein n=1 Tax=Archangium lansingense TaxID=2995310 RepID=A0ABT4AMK3_9BACT|nr:hypothetical protein [Archangium lansinium]MCY1082922.1 hypothetical protein [Archangium lansinium]
MKSQRLTNTCGFQHFRFHALALGVLLLGAPGCQPDTSDEGLDTSTGTVEGGLRVANSLTTQALVLNAISTNPWANDLVAAGGLAPLFHPVTGNTYLRLQLRDVDAQRFMSYLVSCALPAGNTVAWKDPLTSTVRTWEGKAGLCPQWELGAPTDVCKRRVSSCLLARNNALGRRVELSMRGEDPLQPTLFSLETETRPVEYDPDLGNARVPSYETCTSTQLGVSRDCGWTADFIGRCTPGQTVRLGTGGKAPDQCTTGSALGSSSGARMMLRVCDGIIGCDQGSDRNLGQSQGTCATTNAAVTFTCGSGFFNVMSAPYDSSLTGAVNVAVETSTSAATSYRLSEKAVYRVREGAYYGNIFDSTALATKVFVDDTGHLVGKDQIIQGSVYKKMFSCQAPEWTNEAAYASHRVCALPGSGANCAAKPVGDCFNYSNPLASKCKKDDGAVVWGDGDFEECYDPSGTLWNEPITVFLNEPCGLMPGAPADSCVWRGSSTSKK